MRNLAPEISGWRRSASRFVSDTGIGLCNYSGVAVFSFPPCMRKVVRGDTPFCKGGSEALGAQGWLGVGIWRGSFFDLSSYKDVKVHVAKKQHKLNFACELFSLR